MKRGVDLKVQGVAEIFPIECPGFDEEPVLLGPQSPINDDWLALLTHGTETAGLAQVVGKAGGGMQEMGTRKQKSRSCFVRTDRVFMSLLFT